MVVALTRYRFRLRSISKTFLYLDSGSFNKSNKDTKKINIPVEKFGTLVHEDE